MSHRIKYIMLLSFILMIVQSLALPIGASAKDLTTKYRVYQNNRIISEFADKNKAIAYAKGFTFSHVEDIKTREWLWDNFPRYRVYQYDNTLPQWQFSSLDDAIKEAKKWAHASVRDMQNVGWVWNNYPKEANFRLYQGEHTQDQWEFDTLEDAKKAGKKWAHAHIIDLNNNTWVWDNLTDEEKAAANKGENTYHMFIEGYTEDGWRYSSLKEAINAASKQYGAEIENTATHEVVYTNKQPYEVLVHTEVLDVFHSLDDAIAYAKKSPNSVIQMNGREIWVNIPYYQVYQGDRLARRFNLLTSALSYAKKYSNASIRTYHDEMLWDNARKLQVWSWNGKDTPEHILAQVSQTQGLDVDSPTWFELKDANGNFTDTSDKSVVDWLHSQNIQVHPLISNAFDSKLTVQFLNNPQGQAKFTKQLIARLKEIGADGMNIDFESFAASARDSFTGFVKQLSAAAHQQGLIVSVDLPRGSVSWNDRTPYDHAKLYAYVDYIVIMAYDQYYSGSPTPGSVSGLPWAEGGIEEFLSYGIPRDKLIMGIPFYSRLWKLDQNGKLIGNRSLLLKDVADLMNGKIISKQWDDGFQQYKVTYQEDGYQYVFWMEDDSTLANRIKIAKRYELAGVAAWKLGHEPASVWSSLIQEK